LLDNDGVLIENFKLEYFYVYTKVASTKEKSNYILEKTRLKGLIINHKPKLVIIGANHMQDKFLKAKIIETANELDYGMCFIKLYNTL